MTEAPSAPNSASNAAPSDTPSPNRNMLLATKLGVPPTRPDLVQRPRLVELLDQGLSSRLILISAPAGFGKTTLISEWISSLPRRALDFQCAWLTLDEGDSDPVRFLNYLIQALRQIAPLIGQSVQGMLQSPQRPPPQALLTALINDIAALPDPFILVLDDYHLITELPVHQQMAFLLEHQPSQMHLVIVARQDPLLPLARLRARGQVVEIRQADLQFNMQETARFLRQMAQAELSAADIAAIQHRTEGWAAGLQLLALSIRGHEDLGPLMASFTSSSRYILDYLMEEVFQRQTARLQDFLLKTSVLERLTAPLCDAVTGRDDGRETLLALERANLFIVALDPSQQWYRYHHLFGDLLRHRLETQARPDIAELHRRASQWYQAQGYIADAIHHSLAARNWEQAATLIGQTSDEMLKRGEFATLIYWCRKLPDEMVRATPPLCMAYAWALLLAGQFDAAGELLEHTERLGQADQQLLGQVATAQAYLARARGDNQRLIEKSQQALALLPETERTSRGMLALNLGLAYWHEGRLEQALEILPVAQSTAQNAGNRMAELTAQIFSVRVLACRGALRQAAAAYQQVIQSGGQISIVALAHYDQGALHYEWNQLDKAEEHVHVGLEMSIHSGNVEFQIAGRILQAYIKVARRGAAAALERVETSYPLANTLPPSAHARVAACHTQIALALGDLDTAMRVGKDVPANVDAHPFYRFFGLTQQRLLIAQGQKHLASEQLAARLETASRAGWGYAVIAVRVLQSLAADKPQAALDFLAQALRSAQPEGMLRAFADAGEPLAPILQEAALRGIMPEYVGQILAAIRGPRGPVAPSPSPLVESLSERELAVLRLVAAGLSNREIAAKLIVSPGTAKSHVNHICGKLGARNRTEAVARAKELGLV
jgi:ATP/maltotriose-dependent transcriptional regulator MalT